MAKSDPNKAPALLLLLPAALFFIYWALRYYLAHDLVWDELVSLTNFILVDLKTTATHYPDVNNHIFFSLVYNIYARILDIHDLYQAMDHTIALRSLLLLLSLGTVTYTFAAARQRFSVQTGALAAAILVTTLPFLNFTMQLRGYTFGAFFLVMLLYHADRFLRTGTNTQGLLVIFSTTALIYSLPSNIYFALCVGLVYTFRWYRQSNETIALWKEENTKKKHAKVPAFALRFKQNRNFHLLLLLASGAFLSYLLYIPVLEDLLNERHLQQLKGQSHYMYNLGDVFPKVFFYFFSYRFLFVIPIIISLPLLFKKHEDQNAASEKRNLLFLLAAVLLPFALSLIRGDHPHQRTFMPLAPFFSIIVAGFISKSFENTSFYKNRFGVLYGLVLAYCIGSFFYCRKNIHDTLHKAINDGEMVYNSFYNFYQSDEYGYRFLDPLIEAAKSTQYPIIMAQEIDRVAEGEYLQKNDLKYFSTVWAKEAPDPNGQGKQLQVLFEMSNGKGNKPGYSRLAFPGSVSVEAGKLVPMYYFLVQQKIINGEDPHFYVLTFAPRWFEKIMSQYFPQLKAEKISEGTNYHNSYLVTKR